MLRVFFPIVFLLIGSTSFAVDFQVAQAQPKSPKASDVVQSSVIHAPDKVEPGKPFSITIAKGLPYVITPKLPPGTLQLFDKDGNAAIVIFSAEPPGYQIVVDYSIVHPSAAEVQAAKEKLTSEAEWIEWIVKNNADEIYHQQKTIKVEKSPEPGPEPVPSKGPFWLIFLEQSEARSPEMAKILADVDFLKAQKAKGNRWRVYDADSPDAQAYAALTTHRPALIIQEAKTGKLVKTMPLPRDASGIEQVLKEIQSDQQ